MLSLDLSLRMLESVLLADTVFIMGNFLPFDIALEKKSTLFMDAEALTNLEILEISYINILT